MRAKGNISTAEQFWHMGACKLRTWDIFGRGGGVLKSRKAGDEGTRDKGLGV